MNVDTVADLQARARLHAALSDATRLAIVDALVLGDVSPSELRRRLDVSSNLLAHHLKILEAEGLLARGRSEADRRRSYVRLIPGRLADLGFNVAPVAVARIVFVCTANSARSQLAAALWRQASSVPAASAGTHPAARVDPGAVATARRHELRLRETPPRALGDIATTTDLIITVCDNAHEELRAVNTLHWSVPDPVRLGTDVAYDTAYDELARRVSAVAPRLQAS